MHLRGPRIVFGGQGGVYTRGSVEAGVSRINSVLGLLRTGTRRLDLENRISLNST